jgi:chemotaxis protein methyltransferase WspC
MQLDFEKLLRNTIGLDAQSIGSGAIEFAVKSRMESLGCAADEYWQRVLDSEAELQELIEAVIVPETWFFRDEEAFVALRSLILDEWLPCHLTRQLRILSVPCCSGEEPYSIAMALLHAGFSHDRFRIEGFDVSQRAIARGRRGAYGANSFRGKDMEFRDRYFHFVLNEGYCITPNFAGRVSLEQGNLLSPEFGLKSGTYDVIFCRNLLIYFDRDTQERVLAHLRTLLDPDGYLFVGPAEAYLAACNGYKSVNQSMSFAFRNPLHSIQCKPTNAPAIPNRVHVAHSAPKIARARIILPNPAPAIPASAKTTETVPVSAIDLDRATSLADAGFVAEAAELCEAYLKQRGPSPQAYYLLGLVRDAVGDVSSASDCYRKALYLDPNHAEALMHLALLAERQGDAATGRRLLGRALRVGAAR